MGVKICMNCKHGAKPEFNEPCASCDHCSNWEDRAPQWISVEDRLPDKAVTGCLVYADEWTRVADWTHDKWGIEWWFYVDGEYDPEITHWMPLPEPPEEAT